MANKVVVFFGPDRAFDELVQKRISRGEITVGYLDSIRVYNSRIRASEMVSQGPKYAIPEKVDNCVVHANDFGSVVSHVISSFATILEEAYDVGTVYVQNPPARALSSLRAAHSEDAVEEVLFEYERISKNGLPKLYNNLVEDVLGQEESKKAIIASLYKLSVMEDYRPSVILFYGPSGIGKTETAKKVSESLGGNLTRIQFSMMQTNEAYDYLFGAEHSKASFARDLLKRESNIVLIDEFDKVQPVLYNLFYQLFDEGRFVDTNYDVDMRNGLFILTSNFSSEREARCAMGSAMFSRISACIEFKDLDDEEKMTIIGRKYDQVLNRLDSDDQATVRKSNILSWFTTNVARYDNMRTMKNKIEKAIFELLSAPIIGDIEEK